MSYEWTDSDDWRIEQMSELGLHEERLSEILARVRPNGSHFKVTILEPGLSGFQVLHVQYIKNSSDESLVLKLCCYNNDVEAREAARRERDARIEFSLRNIPREVAVPSADESIITDLDEHWLCVIFPDATLNISHNPVEIRQTFKQYYTDRLVDTNIDIPHETEKLHHVLEVYKKLFHPPEIIQTHPWSSDPARVEPLAQSDYLPKYRKNIWQVFTQRHDLASALAIEKNDIRKLLEFIESGRYDNTSIDPQIVDMPVAMVHGDLNGGNVLLSSSHNSDVVFIDFAHMSQRANHHALFDIGKLSIEFERFILPESVFDRNCPTTLQSWCDIHNLWIQERDKELEQYNVPAYQQLLVLYKLLSEFRSFSIDHCLSIGIDNTELCMKHFLYTRLHHLLRMINHPYVTTPRKLFAIKASIDILGLFTGNQRKHRLAKDTLHIFFDDGPDQKKHFVDYLARSNSVIVVGITNEHLYNHLTEAWNKRNRKCWDDIRVVFLAKNLLKFVHDPPERNLSNRENHWDVGVRRIRQLLLEGFQDQKLARYAEIRHYAWDLSFVGQLFDNQHARASFLYPHQDVKESSYINLHQVTSASNGSNRAFRDIANAFSNIVALGTSLVAAQVVGHTRNPRHDKFEYECLIPQSDWQNFSIPNEDQVVHLLSFILLRYNDRFLLIKRTKLNATDQYGKLGLISKKVTDEDFLDDPVPREYRETVFKMQKAHYDFQDGNITKENFLHNQVYPLAKKFSELVDINPGQPIDNTKLEQVCKKSAVRAVSEKLYYAIKPSCVHLCPGPFIVDRRRDISTFTLFPLLFIGDIVGHYDFKKLKSVSIPEIKNITANELLKLSNDGALTQFLSENADRIIDWHEQNPWQSA